MRTAHHDAADQGKRVEHPKPIPINERNLRRLSSAVQVPTYDSRGVTERTSGPGLVTEIKFGEVRRVLTSWIRSALVTAFNPRCSHASPRQAIREQASARSTRHGSRIGWTSPSARPPSPARVGEPIYRVAMRSRHDADKLGLPWCASPLARAVPQLLHTGYSGQREQR